MSRTPSADSIVKARWIASRLQNSTATQNSPGWPGRASPRSGSRATPNSISTSTANGATCWVATCERSSIRRSLPATRRRVTEQGPAPRSTARRRRRGDGAAGDRDDAVGQGLGPVELVRGQHDGGAGRRARRTRPSSRSRPSWSSPAWGSSSSHSSGRRATRQASAVRRRCPADSRPPRGRPGARRARRRPGRPPRRPGGRPRRGPRTARCRPRSARRRARWRGRAARPAGARPSRRRSVRSRPSTRASPARPARARRSSAAAWSCRRRSGRGGAPPLRPRPPGRPRRGRGTGRGA